MEKAQKHLIIVAGEASGDMHAAHLVNEIKSLDSSITFSGVGGKKMEESGVKLYSHLADLAVVGFTEVLKHYAEIRHVFKLILSKVRETNATAVILVDFPGFNLRLAKELKEQNVNVKVIYYISPQVWAWKENRVDLIRRCVDKMLVLFQFEKEFYQKRSFDVDFVGHPLLDIIKVQNSPDQFLESIGLSKDKLTIGILPGSRKREIERLLPVMLDAAKILYGQYKDIQFLLFQASTIDDERIKQYAHKVDLPLRIINKQNYDGINATNLCMVTSGTATLETAILKKPMVVVYKSSFLTWALAKSFIKIPYIGLVNVVAGKKIVPECIQLEATAHRIAEELKAILENEPRISEIKSELAKVKSILGDPGANHRAAAEILKIS